MTAYSLQPSAHSRRGQTLIEVIIAVGLIVLVLTTLASGVALGVKNNRYAKDAALSKEYVRESLEWLRNMRDQTGWETFAGILDRDTGGTTLTYCLTSLPATPDAFNGLNNGNCGGSQTIDGRFTRQMAITLAGNPRPTSARVVVTVSWVDGAKTFSSSSNVTLYQRN